MTDNQHGPAQGEPAENQPSGASPEAAADAATGPAAPVASSPTAEAATPATPTTPQPTQSQTSAAAQPAPPAPAAPPTGTLYAPGQTPQPYHAAQYSHQAATPGQQPAAQPQQPQYGQPAQQAHAGQPTHVGQQAYAGQQAPAGSYGQPGQQHPGQQHAGQQHAGQQHAGQQHAGQQHAGHTATQPTQPLPGGHGNVPPAFGGPTPPQASSGQPKQRRVGLGVAAAIVAAALIGGASGAGIATLVDGDRTTTSTESAATGTQNIVVNDADSVNQITAVAAKASPSVVTISVASGESGGTGSGIILSDDGYVLTNTHVVTLDGATADATIDVKTSDGRLYTAELIGTDPLTDLAVIKLNDASGLEPLEFADSDALNVGDVAIAIGAPLGLSGTVTNGIVSALNRSISVQSSAAPDQVPDEQQDDQQQGQQPFDFWNFDIPGQEGGQQSSSGSTIAIPVIQTDAAINPGNSGGALVDSEGKLIGVNVAILSTGGSSTSQAGNIGVGFAVPSNVAERVAQELIESGTATHGLLGATVQSAQAEEDAATVGALIGEVSAGGAAASAGLEAGDVITEFNGIPITDQTDLTAQVRAQAGGAKAEITYVRDGESTTVEVTLGTFQG
jgi:putative serine protease PepD